MPIEHEEPLLVSGSSQYSDTDAQYANLPPNPNLHIYTSPSPAHHIAAYSTNPPPTQSYHVTAPYHTNSTASQHLPPLLLYPTGAPNQPFAPLTAIPMSMDTILVRVTYAFSWSSWDRQYRFPTDVPSYASPHLSAYLTGAEWCNSMLRLNAALAWAGWVQAVRLLSLVVLLGSVAAMWSKTVRSQGRWTILCWSSLLLSGVLFVLLTKLFAGRVRKRLLEAVEAEHVYYSNKSSAPRHGLLQSSWRMDGRWLIVSAPTQAPTSPISYIMSTPHHIGEAGRAASQHYQHTTDASGREGHQSQHTPMEHF